MVIRIRHGLVWPRAVHFRDLERAKHTNRRILPACGSDSVLHGSETVVIGIVTVCDRGRGNRGIRVADAFQIVVGIVFIKCVLCLFVTSVSETTRGVLVSITDAGAVHIMFGDWPALDRSEERRVGKEGTSGW